MTTPVTIQRIMEATCKRYGVSIADIIKEAGKEKKKRRTNNAAYAKQVVYYLSVRYLIYSPMLWKFLGDADHTQRPKAFKTIMALRQVDRVTHFLIEEIEVELGMMSAAGTLGLMMIHHEELILQLSDKDEKAKNLERLADEWLELAKIAKHDMKQYIKQQPSIYQPSLFQ
jgi:hypothetical protein